MRKAFLRTCHFLHGYWKEQSKEYISNIKCEVVTLIHSATVPHALGHSCLISLLWCHSLCVFKLVCTHFQEGSIGWKALARVAGLCNRAVFIEGQAGKSILDKVCNGDASETALLKCFELEVGNIDGYRLQYPRVCEIPFNSANKYQVCEIVVTWLYANHLFNLYRFQFMSNLIAMVICWLWKVCVKYKCYVKVPHV